MTTLALPELAAKSGEAVKAGPIGLAVILLLCIACYFLFKSMSTHLRNVRENFPQAPPAPLGRPASAVAKPVRPPGGAPGDQVVAPQPPPGPASSPGTSDASAAP